MPDIQFQPVAIATAVVLNFFLGYVWYTPLFGKAWAREMGLPPDHQFAGRQLALGLVLNLLGCLLVAVVLSSQVAVWTPQSWGLSGPGLPPVAQALNAAGFTWLGYMVPVLLNGVAWEQRSWRFFAINAGYQAASLLVAALVLTHMR